MLGWAFESQVTEQGDPQLDSYYMAAIDALTTLVVQTNSDDPDYDELVWMKNKLTELRFSVQNLDVLI